MKTLTLASPNRYLLLFFCSYVSSLRTSVLYLYSRKAQEKSNKKAARTAEEDFFRPLFHRLLSSGKPSTHDVVFPASSCVPKLTELCMAVMLQNSLSKFSE